MIIALINMISGEKKQNHFLANLMLLILKMVLVFYG